MHPNYPVRDVLVDVTIHETRPISSLEVVKVPGGEDFTGAGQLRSCTVIVFVTFTNYFFILSHRYLFLTVLLKRNGSPYKISSSQLNCKIFFKLSKISGLSDGITN